MSTALKLTIGNLEWLRNNREKLLEVFPEKPAPLNPVQAGLRLKTVGVDWRSYDELTNIFIYLERIKAIELSLGIVKRGNPSWDT